MVSANPDFKTTVSIVKADDYDYKNVFIAVERSLELIGGLDKIVKRGNNVFVKINHLPPSSPPEKGIVTHPVFVKAVVELLKKQGANITVGDDLGSEPLGQRDPEGIDGFSVSGVRQVCQESGVKLVNLRETGFIETACQGFCLKEVYISKIAADADVIVNLPKLKTHSLTTYTGGIKNLFGAIPKGKRLLYHYTYSDLDSFHRMLVDVFSAVKPHLTIMDGIIAMEGNGPAQGSLKNLGIVLASRDTVALDTVATKIIGLEQMSVPTIRYACEKGLGEGHLQNIEVVGEKIEAVAVSGFKLPSVSRMVNKKPSFLTKIAVNFMGKMPSVISSFVDRQRLIKPTILKRLCTGCEECRKTCPAGAISMVDKKASVDKNKCISCYCCHEVCRHSAIILKRPFFKKIIDFIPASSDTSG